MDRRAFLTSAVFCLASAALRVTARAAESGEAAPPVIDYADVVARARELAAADHALSAMPLSPPFADLGIEQYRAITMRPQADPLSGQHGFGLSLLPPGSIYRDRVTITLVGPDSERTIPFSPDVFAFDPARFDLPEGRAPAGDYDGLDYTGFRLSHAINRPDVRDEFVVFQGASFFQAVGRRMIYGLSARGLAIDTADPRGEEFPVFSHFWIMVPAPDAPAIVVLALLQSPSCTGAFAFEITPGETTVMQIRCTLFPRVDIAQIGIAPLTSMYYLGPAGPHGISDFRNAVHDSEGLQMIRGDGGRLWRPLSNPRLVQTSAFLDENPKGFGLVQRHQDFAYYQDHWARYEKRPSCWVEPLGEWGKGAVILVEIPIENDLNDNIVCFWRPAEPLGPAEAGHTFTYRLHWGSGAPDAAPLARIAATRTGVAPDHPERQIIVVDFQMEESQATELRPDLWTSGGDLSEIELRPLPESGLTRVSFEVSPGGLQTIEMQLYLEGPGGRASETWLYRWSPN